VKEQQDQIFFTKAPVWLVLFTCSDRQVGIEYLVVRLENLTDARGIDRIFELACRSVIILLKASN
jgi:hypothetical protein